MANRAKPNEEARKDAEQGRIAAESRALTERARMNKLRFDDLGGGTFTVSNLGMFDVEEFIAIINPPEAAILAVGAVTRRPVRDKKSVWWVAK